MIIEAVVILDHAGRSAFGSDRVAAHGINFREQAQVERRIGLGYRDRRAQAGSASSDDGHVRADQIHWPMPGTPADRLGRSLLSKAWPDIRPLLLASINATEKAHCIKRVVRQMPRLFSRGLDIGQYRGVALR